jgi:hypothetical protein
MGLPGIVYRIASPHSGRSKLLSYCLLARFPKKDLRGIFGINLYSFRNNNTVNSCHS